MKANLLRNTVVHVAAVSTKVSQVEFAYRLRAMAIPSILSVPLRCELKKLCVKDEEALAHAVHSAAYSLKKGHVIAVPTDTVYGIAGLVQNSEAVNRLYSIKNRNCSKPIAISVGDIDDLYRWSKVVVPKQILEDLLPGPVTVVFERSPELNPLLNPNTNLVGIRIPDHAFIRNLARACGSPIALTSANKSSDQSTLSLDEFKSLWPQLDLLINGGELSDTDKARLGSTVVDLSEAGKFCIIREGSAYKKTSDILKVKHKLQEIVPSA